MGLQLPRKDKAVFFLLMMRPVASLYLQLPSMPRTAGNPSLKLLTCVELKYVNEHYGKLFN